ncbi:MAG: M20/M25/M40 family metallo-hydrolase [Oscillospiraceae bacterium]|nr:M20/M25/M40 family metallo-hydrolase [Oscillospiraceae bacterium]
MEKTKTAERIREILGELMAMRSTTGTAAERAPAEWFAAFFRAMPYFRANPELTGLYEIPGDGCGRAVPYALLLGKKRDTVVLSGHFDVVSAEEYGAAEAHAYALGDPELERMLEAFPLNERQRADLASGEWFWGRGTADMKGGLAVHAALFEEYASLAGTGELPGSLLLLPVPDEESYSAGMRAASTILRMLQEKYGLRYQLLIDPEPTPDPDGVQVLSLGSVGKLMPAVFVQGKKSHINRCFEGVSALSVLTDIFAHTDGAAEFCDVSDGEATVPPVWANLRDRKRGYDVSLPERAAGYFTLLTLRMTPEQVLARLKRVCAEAFGRQIESRRAAYDACRALGASPGAFDAGDAPRILSFAELCAFARENDPEFDAFLSARRAEAAERIAGGETNFPDATVELVEAALDRSGIRGCAAVIAFAPPYYPSVHADRVGGKTGRGSEAFRFAAAVSEREFDQKLASENYFMGISDLSYSAVTEEFDFSSYSANAPLWGDAYRLNFDAFSAVAAPGIIYGPIGREYHTFAERVNKRSLLTVVPAVTRELIGHIWEL